MLILSYINTYLRKIYTNLKEIYILEWFCNKQNKYKNYVFFIFINIYKNT